MNENTKVRDELARLAGFEERRCQNKTGIGSPFYYSWFKDGKPDSDYSNGYRPHPIPNTLDEAAKLPEGWWYWVNYHGRTDGLKAGEAIREAVCCEAVPKHGIRRVRVEADTELAARFALRLAVEKIEHERRAK